MPRTVLRQSVGGDDCIPAWHLLDRERHAVFAIAEWCAEQGIADYSYVEKIEVTEFDDGTLVAYLTRRELYSAEEFAAIKAERGDNYARAPIRVFHDGGPLTRTFVEHHPVTSIALLLNQFRKPEIVGASA